MRKFLAVVKREYLKLVWTKMFIVGTLLAPLMGVGFAVVPALLFSIEGDATRIAVVDDSGKIFEPVKNALTTDKKREQEKLDVEKQLSQSQEERARENAKRMNARFIVEEIKTGGKTPEQVKNELNSRLREQKLDAYVLVPVDVSNGDYELYARNTSDFVAQSRIERALNEAVREARMAEANLSRDKLDAINREVKLVARRVTESGESEDSGESFILLFIVGLMIYLVLAIYGQTILGAVVEEKETRIAEILFSSARPFTLMMGKLVGVGMVALTQLAIWVLSGAAVLIYGLAAMKARGMEINVPQISPFFIVGLLVFFLLGFFTYATVYALIGSMVTTVQEGGQLALIPVLMLLGGFYSVFPVIRSPNSDFSVWISLLPFLSPIVMPVRMGMNMPPFWQISVSVLLSLLTIIALVWVAARAYRIGMLMYGKKATIPEVFRWIRQS
ncbi:MAG: ABC transporter permease [Pyrinomonadaceae bacterium]